MDEGILEVNELAGDRVVDELHGVGLITCLSMYSNNSDSVTNNLRNSANGTFVTSDDTFPLTGLEKDDEVRREVKGEVEQLRENRTCAWREDGMPDSRYLSQLECDVSVTKKTKHLKACRRSQTTRMLCLCL